MLRSDADAPKPPAYPFITSNFQRAIVRQKTCDPPIPWRIPSRLAFRFSRLSLRSTVASVRHRHVSASVRRYLRRPPGSRKSKKHEDCKNFAETGKRRKILWLAQETPQTPRRCGNFLALAASRFASGRRTPTHSTFGNQSKRQ